MKPEMNLNELSRPLDASEIDFRMQSITEKGVIIIPYKDARADMKRLNHAVGVMGWKREHVEISNRLYCIVSIWDKDTNQWISKMDVGVESKTEKEKGQASDSFKRACTNWGIGMDLYEYPFIFINLAPNEITKDAQGKLKLANPYFLKDLVWKNKFDNNGELVELTATYGETIKYHFKNGKVINLNKKDDPKKDDSKKDEKKTPTTTTVSKTPTQEKKVETQNTSQTQETTKSSSENVQTPEKLLLTTTIWENTKKFVTENKMSPEKKKQTIQLFVEKYQLDFDQLKEVNSW